MLKYIKQFTITFGSSIGLLIVCIISATQLIKKLVNQSVWYKRKNGTFIKKEIKYND